MGKPHYLDPHLGWSFGLLRAPVWKNGGCSLSLDSPCCSARPEAKNEGHGLVGLTVNLLGCLDETHVDVGC